jgi:DNA topoisomerase-1
MRDRLLIVESPAKAKTIKKYVGKGYQVLASYGHVRDLLPKEGAVDPNNDFAMKYVVIERNAKHVKAIAEALKNCDELLLATDPDREGEAISYHVYELMKEKNLLKSKPVRRVVFYEVTKPAILQAITDARELSMDLVEAQIARRALDYLVGFHLSPQLWRKIRPGLSAGRVQTPALRQIVEREEEIEKFEAKEYWTIEALTQKLEQAFHAKLVEYQGEKLKQFSIVTQEAALAAVNHCKEAGKQQLKVVKVDKKQRKRNPSPPFTTSTLQQEASRKLGFGTQRTMKIAQQLYEGVDIGQGTVGLITYMRTDSVHVSNLALDEIRAVIVERYGKESIPSSARVYKTKSKNAQEAHEAIRPTSAQLSPDQIKEYLSAEQLKLYTLIWKRTLASQMIHATIDTVTCDLSSGPGNTFRVTGSVVAHPGFLAVYEEGLDDSKTEEEKTLPAMQVGDILPVNDMKASQHFTEPPPRFSEASLVKILEELGIGRPSTYASIISTLQQREYVELRQKRFYPTDVGRVVSHFLTKYFTQYVDYDFTAKLEDDLDAVARGEEAWKPLLAKFWKPFIEQVKDVDKNVQRKDVTQEAIDEKCPKCGAGLSIRLGKRGRFIGCTRYPECDYTRNIQEDGAPANTAEVEVVEGRVCPECQHPLHIKKGKYGRFIGCSNYPTCKHMEPLEKPQNTGVECPECKKGMILKRKSRNGKIFYSCERYPDCKYALWDMPFAQPCPLCNWPITAIKTTKARGTERVCPQKSCKFAEPYDDTDT